MSRTKRPLWMCLLAAAGLLAAAAPAPALVLHPSDEGPPPVCPLDAAVGQWMGNASCVAIDPNYIITTRHQGGGVGGTVTIGGLTYTIAEEFDHSTADIRVVRLTNADGTPADLSYYIPPYTGTHEATKTVVIGGYGKGRGSDLVSGDVTYGYTWAGTSNSTLRWGANYVDSVTTPASLYSLATLNADFDGPDQSHVSYEAAVAQWDSGGGWFINVGAEANPIWQVAGLSHGAQNAVNQESLFLSSTNPTQPAPDGMDAVRVSTYAGWIAAVENRSEWNSTSGGSWGTSGNWTNGAPSGTDQFAILGSKISGNQTVTLNSNVTLGTLRFDSADNYTLSRSGTAKLTFFVTSGAATIDVFNLHGNGAHTITAPVTLDSHLIITQNSAGDFTFSGAIGGPGALIKQGAGTVVLGAVNTFTGNVNLQGGTLRVLAAGGLGNNPIGSTKSVTLAGGTLDLRNDDASTTYAQDVTVSGDATINVASGGSGSGNKFSFNNLTIAGSRTLTVTGASGYALEFAGQASLSNTVSNATLSTPSADVSFKAGLTYLSGSLTKTGIRTLTIAGSQNYGVGTALNVAGGTVNLNSDVGATTPGALAVNVSGSAALNMAATQHMASLDLAGTALATLSSGGTKTLVTKSLSLAGGSNPAAKLDLADNFLVVDYDGSPSSSPRTQIQDYVKAGMGARDAIGRVHWDGAGGITSSVANANNQYLRCAIGVMDNSFTFNGNRASQTTFGGQPVDTSSVLVRYTYWGDLNLDGVVNYDDISVMLYYYHTPEPDVLGWQTGDLNYDGLINYDDLSLMLYGNAHQGDPQGGATNLNGPGVAELQALLADGAPGGLAGVVPEPATLALVALGAAALAGRRRRPGAGSS